MIVIMPNGDIVATSDKEVAACLLLIEGGYEQDDDDPRRFRNLMADEDPAPCKNCRGL